jgi:multidrug efflux pump subunit AcrB
MKFKTLAIHSGHRNRDHQGAVMTPVYQSIPGVGEVLTTGGLNLLTNAYTSNNASVIAMLKPWDERKSDQEQLAIILATARKKFAAYPEAISMVFPPPPINGLGNASGFVFDFRGCGTGT